MAGWGSSAAMSMPEAHNFVITTGQFRGMCMGDVVMFNPAAILRLRMDAIGAERTAAQMMVPLARNIAAKMDAIGTSETVDTMDTLPF